MKNFNAYYTHLRDCIAPHFHASTIALKEFLHTDNLKALRPQLHYQTGVLAGFSLLAAFLLGVADISTRGAIALRLEEDLKANLEIIAL